MSLALEAAVLASSPSLLRTAWERRSNDVRANGVIPFIIVVAIIVVLALGVTVTVGAVIMCAARGGVLDTVVRLDQWTVQLKCHK
jgi:hypothetical protein